MKKMVRHYKPVTFIFSVYYGWHRGVAVACRTRDQEAAGSRLGGHYGVKTLGKFLTPVCLCHQAV